MADPARKVPENVPGAWYVDMECIDCGLCQETAPENFARQEDKGYAYVCRQPEGQAELEACERAREECPAEAIGNDGAA